MKHVVGIDIETTSLDPTRGEIIEVAAVKYIFGETSLASETSFVRLCKPSRPISAETTALTGITNEMVADAPTFAEIISALQEFIGDDLIFAHNASFDTKWLTYYGLSLDKNKVWDTFMIASVAWPETESYNLKQLFSQTSKASETSVTASGRKEHSALYDVEMTWAVLRAARKELSASPQTLKRIAELLERTGLQHYTPLFTSSPAFSSIEEKGTTTNPAVQGEVKDILGPSGPLAKHWSGFSSRAEQQQMAESVHSLLQDGGVGLIEAATGTGKTVAYLTPLLLSSDITAQQKAVISTYTKHLQDQLVTQDAPRLQAALGTRRQVAILKGRRNYVCSRRLGLALQRLNPPARRAGLLANDVWFLVKVLLWLDKGGSGDLDRLNISHQGDGILNALHADSRVCRRGCGRIPDSTCPYQTAVRLAQAAEILVVNHALVADPSFLARWPLAALVVDEAHHFSSALRRASRRDFASKDLQELLSPLLHIEEQDSTNVHLRLEASQAVATYRELLHAIDQFLQTHTAKGSLRLTAGVRRSREWGKIEKQVDQWMNKASFICGLLQARVGLPGADDSLLDLLHDLQGFSAALGKFVHGDPSRIQWLRAALPSRPGRTAGDMVFLNDVALSIQSHMATLYEKIRTVIFTSATLTTSGNFGYIQKSLGLSSAVTMSLSSSFRLPDNLLIYCIEDAPPPGQSSYDGYVTERIQQIAFLLRGRTLGLFTSFANLNAVFTLLNRTLNKANISLYAQGLTGGRSNILNRFREEPASVLLGCDSFWEGVDVPGDTLSCVVIPKLPFAQPHDPILDALAEAGGLSVFSELALPTMILKLRQGIGRLLRTSTDRGVVVLLDSRLSRSGYADAVFKSFPPGRIKVGSTVELLPAIKKWIGEDVLENWKNEKSIK